MLVILDFCPLVILSHLQNTIFQIYSNLFEVVMMIFAGHGSDCVADRSVVFDWSSLSLSGGGSS